MRIRIDVLNLPLELWKKVDAIKIDGYIDLSPQQFYDQIGFTGGMVLGCKCTPEESMFFDKLYEYGNKKDKEQIQ